MRTARIEGKWKHEAEAKTMENGEVTAILSQNVPFINAILDDKIPDDRNYKNSDTIYTTGIYSHEAGNHAFLFYPHYILVTSTLPSS